LIFNLLESNIDDVLSLNNSRLSDFVDYIYPIELEIRHTTDTDMSVSYLDLHHEIKSEGRLRTKHFDKNDDFNFLIVNFPFICSNILAAPTDGVYIHLEFGIVPTLWYICFYPTFLLSIIKSILFISLSCQKYFLQQ
jgi:hypothetical protein